MTLNDEIGALVLKNTRINPVNQTAYKNAFLLLSSTRALNELVSNTKPSDRARKEGIEDDAQYLKTPTGGRSDRTDPDPKAPKPKARKKAPPKTDATPAQKPKPAPAPAPKKGRPKDPPVVKDTKAAARDATAKAMNSALKGVAKGVKSKIYTDAAKAGKAKAASKKKDGMGLSDKDVKGLFIREPAAEDVVATKIAKQKKEGKLKGDDRRLGTKTQKKKK
tara:strand:+ start:121 stop:783 length:663 start_codon:yes stop_codon:yes gene_type:complete